MRKKSSWFKRLLVVAACVAAVVVVAAAVSWTMLRGRPSWYPEQAADPVAREAAAARAENEFQRTIDWASEQQAAERRLNGAMAAPDAPPPATAPVSAPHPTRSLTVRFTEQELNAAFEKWGSMYRWDEKYGQYVADPRIVLNEGRVIFAGQVKDLGTLLSLHFEPHVEADGRARFEMVRVLGGRLPLPQSMFDKYRRQLEGRVRAALPALQQGARIAPDGSANDKAVAAAMSKLLLRVLAGESDEAVLFLTANKGTQVPVKLTGVKVDGKSISVTVELLNAAERAALLRRIREPLQAIPAAAGAAPAPARPLPRS
jgi:hypothetical protein